MADHLRRLHLIDRIVYRCLSDKKFVNSCAFNGDAKSKIPHVTHKLQSGGGGGGC
jgi:hypothetical protein